MKKSPGLAADVGKRVKNVKEGSLTWCSMMIGNGALSAFMAAKTPASPPHRCADIPCNVDTVLVQVEVSDSFPSKSSCVFDNIDLC